MNLLGLPGLPEFSEKQICILLSKHSHRYTGWVWLIQDTKNWELWLEWGISLIYIIQSFWQTSNSNTVWLPILNLNAWLRCFFDLSVSIRSTIEFFKIIQGWKCWQWELM